MTGGILLEYINEEHSALQEEVTTSESVPQPEKAEQKPISRAKKIYRDARDLFVVMAAFMLVYVLFFRAVVVVGNSMYDTLKDGDRLLLISNVLYRNPERGDIIVASKDSFRNGECIVKRVIAVEGDTVDIDFNTGIVYVNGQALEEDYVFTPTVDPEGVRFPLTVEPGCVFVLGDNRGDSTDSRSPIIGQIDKREILGRVFFLLIPGVGSDGTREFNRIGVIN